MSISLVKGQKISLKKEGGGSLHMVTIGLGWDAAEQQGGGFFSKLFGGSDIDCDASVFLCKGGKLLSNDDVVCFYNLKHRSNAVQHMGDNLTGEGEGDDEQIVVNLEKIPAEYDRLVFVVNIYNCDVKKQHFGMIKNAFIRIVDEKGKEFCKYDLSGSNYNGMTAMIFGEVYRHSGEWKFNAIGEGTKNISLEGLSARYR